jgi:hypothetical protein
MLLFAAPPEHMAPVLPIDDVDLAGVPDAGEPEAEDVDDWWLDLGYVAIPGSSAV